MTDFVDFEPNAQPIRSAASVVIRAAAPSDVDGLAAVMAVRGGGHEEHVDPAGRLIERLNVLLIAERGGVPVGWCGIQKFSIKPDAEPEWLVAGLTVTPVLRRQGIATQLLRGVLRATEESAYDDHASHKGAIRLLPSS